MTERDIQFAAEMWFENESTKEIADELAIDEAEVWNRLDEIKAVKIAEAA